MTFDAMFICGNQEFRTEVIQGFKDSDLVSRVSLIHDIPIAVDSVNVKTIQQLKHNIPNIVDYIQEDTIFAEKQYLDILEEYLVYNESLKVSFGLDDLFANIVDHNIQRIVINETLDTPVSQTQLVQLGVIDAENTIFNSREEMQLVEFLLHFAIDASKKKEGEFELVLIQAPHTQSYIERFGGFYFQTKYLYNAVDVDAE